LPRLPLSKLPLPQPPLSQLPLPQFPLSRLRWYSCPCHNCRYPSFHVKVRCYGFRCHNCHWIFMIGKVAKRPSGFLIVWLPTAGQKQAECCGLRQLNKTADTRGRGGGGGQEKGSLSDFRQKIPLPDRKLKPHRDQGPQGAENALHPPS
jgi:hypothetical protein